MIYLSSSFFFDIALFQACYDGNIDEFLALLDANPLFMTCKDEDGYTLLQRSVAGCN